MTLVEPKDIHAQGRQPMELVWEVCPYLKVGKVCPYLKVGKYDQPCQKCPEWEDEPTYGKVQRGCYALAEEVCQLVRAGVLRLGL